MSDLTALLDNSVPINKKDLYIRLREITGRGKVDVDIDTWSERITSMLHNGMDWHHGNDDDSEPA